MRDRLRSLTESAMDHNQGVVINPFAGFFQSGANTGAGVVRLGLWQGGGGERTCPPGGQWRILRKPKVSPHLSSKQLGAWKILSTATQYSNRNRQLVHLPKLDY